MAGAANLSAQIRFNSNIWFKVLISYIEAIKITFGCSDIYWLISISNVCNVFL